nr:MAG TPA: hypothetical protein [Caudoviricetes sp.]
MGIRGLNHGWFLTRAFPGSHPVSPPDGVLRPLVFLFDTT